MKPLGRDTREKQDFLNSLGNRSEFGIYSYAMLAMPTKISNIYTFEQTILFLSIYPTDILTHKQKHLHTI